MLLIDGKKTILGWGICYIFRSIIYFRISAGFQGGTIKLRENMISCQGKRHAPFHAATVICRCHLGGRLPAYISRL
jgi:hypothetical protein